MIDLHTHSTASDGSYTPTELIEQAHQIGLKAIALTDHDVVDGCPEFQEAAQKYPDLIALSGSELGVDHPANMEILALNIGDLTPYFERQERAIAIRQEANLRRVQLLQQAGYRITWQDVSVDEKGVERTVVAKPHFAGFLFESGQVENKDDAYKLMARGGSAYVKKQDPTVCETIDFIRQTGAVAVLAHPCLIRLKGQDLFNEIALMQKMGLQGIEVYHSDHTPAQIAEYACIAETLGLLKSGGSDYHGASAHAGVELGVGRGDLCVPDELLDGILAASQNVPISYRSPILPAQMKQNTNS